MKILALEFSSACRSVAAVEGARVLGRAEESRARETRALSLLDAALRAAGWEREQVQALAVGLGPGSYTGVRLAISLVEGWQIALQTPTLGLSSAEALAAQAQAAGLRGRVNIGIDAQRNEFYLAVYEIDSAGWRELEPLRLASAGDLEQRAARGESVAGPGLPEGCKDGRVLFPDAGTLGRLAEGRTDFLPAERLEPIYLREIAFLKAPPPRIEA